MTDHVARRPGRPQFIGMFGLALLGVGCALEPGLPGQLEGGVLMLSVPAARTVQYAPGEIKALELTLGLTNNSRHYFHRYTPALLPGSFTFSALNLPIGTYRASLAAYTSTATSSANQVGSTATDSFTVRAGATTAVALPPMTLSATPTGSWPILVSVSIVSTGYTISQATSSLATSKGATVAGPSWTTASKTLKWFNLPTYPSGASTTSVTVKAVRSGRTAILSTKTVSCNVVPGSNATSSLSFSL